MRTAGSLFGGKTGWQNFSRLTKEICDFEAPFDVRFRDMMVNTVKKLMDCGFRVVYGFTESDEISLLFHKEENTFGSKIRNGGKGTDGYFEIKYPLL